MCDGIIARLKADFFPDFDIHFKCLAVHDGMCILPDTFIFHAKSPFGSILVGHVKGIFAPPPTYSR